MSIKDLSLTLLEKENLGTKDNGAALEKGMGRFWGRHAMKLNKEMKKSPLCGLRAGGPENGPWCCLNAGPQ